MVGLVIYVWFLLFIKASCGAGLLFKDDSEIDNIPESDILAKVKVSSKYQCLHRCGRHTNCEDAVFRMNEKFCILLPNSKHLLVEKKHGPIIKERLFTRIVLEGMIKPHY